MEHHFIFMEVRPILLNSYGAFTTLKMSCLLIRANSMMENEYVWIWLIWGPFNINFGYFLPYMVWWHPVTSYFSFLVSWIDSIWINPIDFSFPTFQSVLTRAKLFILTQIFHILLRHVREFVHEPLYFMLLRGITWETQVGCETTMCDISSKHALYGIHNLQQLQDGPCWVVYRGQKKKLNGPEGAKYFSPVEG